MTGSPSPLRRHVARCAPCGVRASDAAGLRLVGDALLCSACRGESPRTPPRAGEQRCRECWSLVGASGLHGFCDACWRTLLAQASEGASEPRPCDHCHRDSRLLIGGPGLAVCPTCVDEADEVFAVGPLEPRTPRKPACSFCQRRSDAVEMLLAGPAVFICSECIDHAAWLEQHDIEESGPRPARCSFSWSRLRGRPSFFVSTGSEACICDECLELAREQLRSVRLVHRSTMTLRAPGPCDLCHRTPADDPSLVQIASGMSLCHACLCPGRERVVLVGPRCGQCAVRDRIVWGSGCLHCWATGDSAILLGPPEQRHCLDCWGSHSL